MANGKPGDNPLTDLLLHGAHPFPPDLERGLLEIHRLGRAGGRWALGENWPYSPLEFDWAAGRGLEEGRLLVERLLQALRQGRGDDLLIDPRSRRPLREA